MEKLNQVPMLPEISVEVSKLYELITGVRYVRTWVVNWRTKKVLAERWQPIVDEQFILSHIREAEV